MLSRDKIGVSLKKLIFSLSSAISAVYYVIFRKKLSEVNFGEYWKYRVSRFDELEGSIMNDAFIKNDAYYSRYADIITSKINDLVKVNSILEVGCYCGFTLSILRKSFPERMIVGCDLNAESLRYCKKNFDQKGDEPVLIRCDGTHLPFRDNSFDMIFTSMCLQHIPPTIISKLMGEIKRVTGRYMLFIEADTKNMSLVKKIQYLGMNDRYAHDYEDILGRHGLRKIEAAGIPEDGDSKRLTLFLYEKREKANIKIVSVNNLKESCLIE